jgi:cobalamin biosynthesis Mg chelatase CobN
MSSPVHTSSLRERIQSRQGQATSIKPLKEDSSKQKRRRTAGVGVYEEVPMSRLVLLMVIIALVWAAALLYVLWLYRTGR